MQINSSVLIVAIALIITFWEKIVDIVRVKNNSDRNANKIFGILGYFSTRSPYSFKKRINKSNAASTFT